MITGAHCMIQSTSAEADSAFFRDVLKLPCVDGGGVLIFGFPRGEAHVHPSSRNEGHELYLTCDDVEAFVAEMRRNDVACEPIRDQGWGLVTKLTLPGGGRLGVYQPRHAHP